jgi:hypothetical protein
VPLWRTIDRRHDMNKPFPELHELIPTPEQVARAQAAYARRHPNGGPTQLPQARDFVQVPRRWVETLWGAPGQTWQVALVLLQLHWKEHGHPVRLGNKPKWISGKGISPRSKWRALCELQRRGLILVEQRPGRAPVVRVFA